MKILLIGNGGREHALAWKLGQSDLVEKIYVAPGNGGTALGNSKAQNVDISSSDFDKLVQFAVDNKVDLVVPGPEQPLVDGIETPFRKVGIPVFGPSAKAARFEGSKTFSKDFMAKHNIPTAAYENFTDFDAAVKYVKSVDHKVVIKASGLAAGKGVLMPQTVEEAVEALKQVMVDRAFGEAGDEVVVEECLEGDELSILAFSDGYTVVDLPPAQDHKRIGDGDTGLNTGGMGTYCPTPIATPALCAEMRKTILQPSIDGMRHDGYPFVGILFVGIMVTKNGPKVLEYNVRFGDPETQSVLALLKTDLAEIMLACVEHRLDAVKVEMLDGYATTVVMSAGGYPESYAKGDVITVDESVLPSNTYVFHAGTSLKDGKIVTSGGRVIAASATAPTLKEAVEKAYKGCDAISFKGKYHRKDIAHRAFRDADKSKVSITYEQAGVSVDNGNFLVEQIKAKVKSTARSGADASIGGFGGVFDLKAAGYSGDALLIGATDGVGTKLKIAQETGIHNTVGIDLVAMSVNDLIVQGAEPLFFLDYFATGRLDIQMAADFVAGVADGCIDSECALIGGETSEMPGLYQPGDYDTNGTCVGAVERADLLPKLEKFAEGDAVIGLTSSGCHSNGYSLIRKIVEVKGLQYSDSCPWNPSKTLGEEFLIPTKIYVRALKPVLKKGLVYGLANITGGGLVENVPRVLPKHLDAVIDANNWKVPEVFKWLGREGNVPKSDVAKTLNMGIGMVVICKPSDVESVISLLKSHDQEAMQIGSLKAGTGICTLQNIDGWY